MTRIAAITHAALTLRDRARMAWPQPSPLTPLTPPLPTSVQKSNAPTDLSQLRGRCHRLEQELALACEMHPPHQPRINRLLQDLATTRREIAAARRAEPAKPGRTRDMPSPRFVRPGPPSVRPEPQSVRPEPSSVRPEPSSVQPEQPFVRTEPPPSLRPEPVEGCAVHYVGSLRADQHDPQYALSLNAERDTAEERHSPATLEDKPNRRTAN
jgi:hypothetical protein